MKTSERLCPQVQIVSGSWNRPYTILQSTLKTYNKHVYTRNEKTRNEETEDVLRIMLLLVHA